MRAHYTIAINFVKQVEHPCTEMVADINLPALQLQVIKITNYYLLLVLINALDDVIVI